MKRTHAITQGKELLRTRRPKNQELAFFPRNPMKLERPLAVFKGLPVNLSTFLSLGPDTILRVLTQTSLQELAREEAPAFHALFRKLSYVAKGDHKLSPGLRGLALAQLPLAKEEIERALDDPEYVVAGPRSHWELLLRGMQTDDADHSADMLVRICQWMADCDAHGVYLLDLVRAGDGATAEAHSQWLFGAAHNAWKHLNPNLAISSLAPLDVAIMALARVDWELRHANSEKTGSEMVAMLEPGSRPLGHWLKQVCVFSDCKNLGELSRALHLKRALYREEAVSHERLKKWARSKEGAMPPAAVEPVLMALNTKACSQAVKTRFHFARLFTFLCDLNYACTVNEACTWEQAQAQVKRRYTEVYRLQASMTT